MPSAHALQPRFPSLPPLVSLTETTTGGYPEAYRELQRGHYSDSLTLPPMTGHAGAEPEFESGPFIQREYSVGLGGVSNTGTLASRPRPGADDLIPAMM